MQNPALLNRERFAFRLLFGFLILTFLIGGGSRPDISSLLVLRPAAVIVFFAGLLTLRMEHVRQYRFLFAMAAAVVVLTASYLVPLPPGIANSLPGHDLAREGAELAGVTDAWRPASLVPWTTRNAFFSLFVPLAVLVLGVQLSADNLRRLLPLVLVFGLLSGIIGMLQVAGGPASPLYFFRITNDGAAVGLFSNRNHSALMLAMIFPMLAVFASTADGNEQKSRIRFWGSLFAAAPIVPLLLVTGSRAGLVLGVFSLGAAAVLYRQPHATAKPRRTGNRKFDPRWVIAAGGLIALALVTTVLSRSEALSRLLSGADGEESRLTVWKPALGLVGDYFPFGSGAGTFVEAYKVIEPMDSLGPTYFNHAHNDYLEILITTGLFGAVLLLVALAAYAKAALRVAGERTSRAPGRLFSRLGFVLVTMIAIASAVDYPVRTPSIAAVLVVAALWLMIPSSQRHPGSTSAEGEAA